MDQDLNKNEYVIDLSYVKNPAEIIYDISILLDSEEARNKRICLKLGTIDLNQSQILSIKSLINSINSTLFSINTKSSNTESAAMAIGIVVANPSVPQAETAVPEMTYKTVEEFVESSQEEVEEESIVPQEYNETPFEETEVEIPSTPRGYEKLEDHQDEEITAEQEVEEEKQDLPQSETRQMFEEITLNIPDAEEIKEELDAIFNTEKKLEEIFDASSSAVSVTEEREQFFANIIEEEKNFTQEDLELESFPTKYIKQTIRSGQVISYEGNIVIIGDCHPGSEIIAAGDITVWGVLSGIAHAGSKGNEKAKVRALKMNAIQLRVANCYARRPDSLNTVFSEKTNVFTPEEARIINGEIVIFKIND